MIHDSRPKFWSLALIFEAIGHFSILYFGRYLYSADTTVQELLLFIIGFALAWATYHFDSFVLGGLAARRYPLLFHVFYNRLGKGMGFAYVLHRPRTG